jgi:hypothetical protein
VADGVTGLLVLVAVLLVPVCGAVAGVAGLGAVAEVTGAAADVADDGGKVAACACRENTSKTAKIPAAKIATCTARRAMCRKVAWDTSSPPVRSGETDLTVFPTITGPKRGRWR